MASRWFPFLLPHVCLRKHASQGVKCRSHLRGKRGQVNGLKSETQEGVLFPRGAPQTGCTHLRIKIPHGIVPIIVSRKSLGWFLFSLGFKAAPGSADDAQNTKTFWALAAGATSYPEFLDPHSECPTQYELPPEISLSLLLILYFLDTKDYFVVTKIGSKVSKEI